MEWARLKIFLQVSTPESEKKQYRLIEQSDVVSISLMDGKVIVATRLHRHTIHRTLQEVVDRSPFTFVQINETQIVNIDNIETVDGMELQMVGGKTFTLTSEYSEKFANEIDENFTVL